MNSENANQNDTSLNRTFGKVCCLRGLCYMPLPAGQSKHVYPNLSESRSVMSSLPKAGFQNQTKESHVYPLSKFKRKPEVPQRKNR